MSNYDALVAKLREIFQIDRPELDFGVYRILNARAGEINTYLSTRLKARVAEALASGAAANTEALSKELAEKIAQYKADGVDPETVPRVKELRAAIAAATAGVSEHENQVFSHLLTFFSRYYDKGDFISQRRYKGDTYAIPYAGEEVMLHWANKDQYYTKSGEAFSNYGFKLDDGRSVQFRLIAADTAKDNRKDNDKERRFKLVDAGTVVRTGEDGETYEEAIEPIVETADTLTVFFEYVAMAKGTKQEALVEAATATVLASESVQARWVGLSAPEPTEKKANRTVIEKMLTAFTQKNSADYFVHKDLGGFLKRELDFYIKNEVMNLDDVQKAEAFVSIEKNLRMIQCLRAIALDLIAFLASIENFQKRLWLKQKFVVSAHWCITLDRVPVALYPTIVANSAQWARWHDLGMRSTAAPGTIADLKAAPSLMVDTALFDVAFRADMLKAIPDLDASMDGLLVHGDNFQALTVLSERYREQIKCIYIDPPYNTGRDGFSYKDGYRRSSWSSLINQGLSSAYNVMTNDGILFISNDDNENDNLRNIVKLNQYVVKSNLIWNTDGHTDNQFEVKVNHEYVTLCQKTDNAVYGNVIDPNTRAESNLWNNIAENSITKNGPVNPFSDVVLPIGFPVSEKNGTIFRNEPDPQFRKDLGSAKYFPRQLIKKHEVSFPIRDRDVLYDNYNTKSLGS